MQRTRTHTQRSYALYFVFVGHALARVHTYIELDCFESSNVILVLKIELLIKLVEILIHSLLV